MAIDSQAKASHPQPRSLFTFAIAVFESAWPRITGEVGDESPRLVGKDSSARSAFKYSGSQNEFTGYYKVVPMNILNVNVSSNKGGHKWTLTTDASLLYVEADPKSISPQLAEFLQSNTLNPAEISANFLVGILEGYSRDAFATRDFSPLQRFVLPGELLSQLVSEMDTCTLFLINELGEFSETEMVRLYGGSFSRLNELEATSSTKNLSKWGFSASDFIDISSDFGRKVQALRTFIANADLQASFTPGSASNLYLGGYDGSVERRDAVRQVEKNKEIAAINEISGDATVRAYAEGQSEANNRESALATARNEASTTLGYTFARLFTPALEARVPNVKEELLQDIETYYSSNHPMSYLIPWRYAKTIQIKLHELFHAGDLYSPDTGFSKTLFDPPWAMSSRNAAGTVSFPGMQWISLAIAMDVAAASWSPLHYSALSTDPDYVSHLEALQDIYERYTLASPDGVSFLPEYYISGVNSFADDMYTLLRDAREDLSELQKYSPDELIRYGIAGDFTRSEESLRAQAIDDLTVPVSSHTPGLVLKGHVTSITAESSVTNRAYTKQIKVAGEGLEMPLKRHNIMWDMTNPGRNIFFSALRFGLSQATPIKAALNVIDTFMPDYVDVRTATNDDVLDVLEYVRLPLALGESGVVVDQGAMIYPSAASANEDVRLFSPIHYLNTAFLHAIMDTFDELFITDKSKPVMNRTVPETNVYSVLGQILGQSSSFSWYIDEFGFVKVRNETAAVAYPSLPILTPYITDDELIKIQTSTSDTLLFTVVEVLPHVFGMTGPTDGRLAGLFGRAVPPTVEDFNVLYTTVKFDIEANERELGDLLAASLTTFEESVLRSYGQIRRRQAQIAEEAGITRENDAITPLVTVINDTEAEDVLDIMAETDPAGTESGDSLVGDVDKSSTGNDISAVPPEGSEGKELRAIDTEAWARISRLLKPEHASKFSDAFASTIVATSYGLGFYPEWLLTVMGFETGYEFKASTPNAQWNPDWDAGGETVISSSNAKNAAAVGLIQFTPVATIGLYKTYKGGLCLQSSPDLCWFERRKWMKSMTEVKQMKMVFDYLSPKRSLTPTNKFESVMDVYLAVLLPAALKSESEIVFDRDGTGSQPTWYAWNKGLDADNDGKVTKSEIRARMVSVCNNLFQYGCHEDTVLPIDPEAGDAIPEQPNPEQPAVVQGVPTVSPSKIYHPTGLTNVYTTNALVGAGESPLAGVLFNNEDFEEFAVKDNRDVLFYTLQTTFTDTLYETEDGTLTNYSLRQHIMSELESTVVALNSPILNIQSFTSRGRRDYLDLMATLAMLGIGPDNVREVLNGQDRNSTILKFILSNVNLYSDPTKLKAMSTENLAMDAQFAYALPYKDFQLQESLSRSLTPDLFRYGLRIYRVDDYYLTSYTYSSYRAEMLRQLHDVPVRASSVSIIGNPIYKLANTALVVTRELEERRHNYVHRGVLQTWEELGPGNDSIILSMHGTIMEGLYPKVYNPWFGDDLVATPEGIRRHFKDAYEFILQAGDDMPVSTAAYVPLYGIYSTGNPLVNEYLHLLVDATRREYREDRSELENQMQDIIMGIASEAFGGDFTMGDVNKVVNLLTPQYWHAYQYSIDSLTHAWSYGGTYRTDLSLSFGLPVSTVHIPVNESEASKFFIIGYLMNKSPHLTYTPYGRPNDVLAVSHPLYTFSLRQQEEEWSFYKTSERYKTEVILEKIRKKILYPSLYGDKVIG